MAWNIKQVDLATEPIVRVVGSERADGRAVMRNSRAAAEPKTRPGEMDYLGVSGAIECIDIEIEAAHCEYAAVAGDWIEDVPGARACDTEYDVAAAGIDERGTIVLCHKSDGAVVGQSHPVHAEWIRPCARNCASVSVKDVKRRILSCRIANNSCNSRAVARRGYLPGTGWQIRIADWIREGPVRCAVAAGPEAVLPKIISCCIRLHKTAAVGGFGGSDAGVAAAEGREGPCWCAIAHDRVYSQACTAEKPRAPYIMGVDRHAIGNSCGVVVLPNRIARRS